MSISFHLSNFPTLNQNHEDTAGLYPNINADMDCVPTSIAAALTWFTGQQYYGDEIIDAVYGSGYTGGTAAVQYVNYCAPRGVKLFPVNGTPDELVTAIHTWVHEGCPVLVTVPGQWNNPATSGANPGAVTHVMVVCGDGPASIQVMNPWTGNFEEYSDAWFHVKLCYGQIWPMEDTAMIPHGPFYKALGGQNGVPAEGNAIAAALGLTWQDVLSIPGQNPDLGKYDPNGPYLGGTANDPSYGVWMLLPGFPPPADTSALQAELAKAQSDLTAEQQEVVNLNVTIGQLKAALAAAQQAPGIVPAGANEAISALKAIQTALLAINGVATLAPVGAQTKPLPAVQ